MLKFYWPYSLIAITFGSWLGKDLTTLFYSAMAFEIFSVAVIMLSLRGNKEINAASLAGWLATQYSFDDSFQLSELIGESALRIFAYMLGAAAIFWYIPSMLILLWSTVKITLHDDNLV